MAYGKRRASGQVSGDEIVVEAAWLYYHDGLNQNEIADRLEVSRATVVNYLQEARERNYIRVTMAPDIFMGHKLSHQLREKFGLKAAFIVPNGVGNIQARLTRAARGAAEWLPDLVMPGDKIGVAWGQTIYELAELLVSSANVTIPDVEVAQLVGSMATPYGFTARYVRRTWPKAWCSLHQFACASHCHQCRVGPAIAGRTHHQESIGRT